MVKRLRAPIQGFETIRDELSDLLISFRAATSALSASSWGATGSDIMGHDNEKEQGRNVPPQQQQVVVDDRYMANIHILYRRLLDCLSQLPEDDDALITLEAREELHRFQSYRNERIQHFHHLIDFGKSSLVTVDTRELTRTLMFLSVFDAAETAAKGVGDFKAVLAEVGEWVVSLMAVLQAPCERLQQCHPSDELDKTTF